MRITAKRLKPPARGWIVEVAGTVQGFAIGNARTGNIWTPFVDPDHERQGLGRQLHDVMVSTGYLRKA